MSHPFDLQEFIHFLVQAKRSTYASGANDTSPILPASSQFEYTKSPFFYRDIYFGSSRFTGQEIVYYQEKPVWSMNYYGGITSQIKDLNEISKIYRILKEALQLVDENAPFRGPKQWIKGQHLYSNHYQGDIESFHGSEHMKCMCTGISIYSLHYHGGFLK
ncbi:DUF5680 domain-containing protein [Thermoflavimicrobium dichotomicum]|uniref:DUF5680 domain-containing protein n=1 Tax=Thermoflavimicrobium dichotomicum TaxID=46223 RepID=A0A1I3UQQ2_9BACL|nr:DUF5680 domain-containing protein [Thermoflavimicrobium dichotomicum]SFJ84191.1 hypothetical protein SAMN05421852_12610 [Thermoflavimicrobium dichotomicum]